MTKFILVFVKIISKLFETAAKLKSLFFITFIIITFIQQSNTLINNSLPNKNYVSIH